MVETTNQYIYIYVHAVHVYVVICIYILMLNDHHESSWSAFLLAVFGTEKLTSGMVIHHHPSIFIGISVYESLGNYWKCTAENGKAKTTSLLI